MQPLLCFMCKYIDCDSIAKINLPIDVCLVSVARRRHRDADDMNVFQWNKLEQKLNLLLSSQWIRECELPSNIWQVVDSDSSIDRELQNILKFFPSEFFFTKKESLGTTRYLVFFSRNMIRSVSLPTLNHYTLALIFKSK